MTTYVGLLRGVNIGPHKRIKMDDLRTLVTDLGYTGARTLVNSGNVVFSADGAPGNATVAAAIQEALLARHDLDVAVVVRTGDDMARIVAANPFPEVAATPKLLHVSFLAEPMTPTHAESLAALDTGDDRLHLHGTEMYLHLPNGMAGANPVTTSQDKRLKVVATSRNWTSVTRLAEMSSEPT